MQIADIPQKMPVFWASEVTAPYVREIPTAPPAQAGAASFESGFPAPNFTPVAAGGIPPYGADMNGIIQQTTKWLRWVQGGGSVGFYDSIFSAAVGGYPQSAMLQAAAAPGNFWISLIDNNLSNPDTGGANWLAFPGTSFRYPSRLQTTNATILFNADSDYSVGLNRSAPAPMAATLAAEGSLVINQVFEIADLSGNLDLGPVTVSPPGGHTIGGEPNYVMTNARQYTRFKYFGTFLWGVQ